MKCILLLALMCVCYTHGYFVEPGPVVIATKGEIWPKPKSQQLYDTFSVIRPSMLQFEIVNHTCELLEEAILRYHRIIRGQANPMKRKLRLNIPIDHNNKLRRSKSWRKDNNFMGYLDTIVVNLKNTCESFPYLGMDESYQFTLRNSEASLESFSIWGMLRGLESISQMAVMADDGLSLRMNSTVINDEPRFSHRGLMLDTSRHFFSIFTINQILDGMAYNKLNIFHWHIVDDHSFPYQSIKFPELHKKGAFVESMSYTQDEIHGVIEYARKRGIRVIAEFDTPGHTRSWGVAHPELLTECGGQYKGKLGPIDPTKEEVYEFLGELFEEVINVFPDQYFHLGGDEVDFECWESSPSINAFMKDRNITTYHKLEELYIQRVVDKVTDLNSSSIVWQEVYQNGVVLPAETVVHIWTGDQQALLESITASGLPALLSTCWYLDHLLSGGDWRKFYECDPHSFNGTPEQKKLVLGGEVCMWAEVVDNTNVIQRIFPRASAAAEKLWSQEYVNNFGEAQKRLEEHSCRMKLRGLASQPPNGPGYCL